METSSIRELAVLSRIEKFVRNGGHLLRITYDRSCHAQILFKLTSNVGWNAKGRTVVECLEELERVIEQVTSEKPFIKERF